MQQPRLILIYLALFLVAFAAGYGYHTYKDLSQGQGPHPAKAETTYQHVLRTGEIRCGYAVWPPVLIKDPNTAALSGIFYDYVEALGRAMHLKIVWAKELDMATYIEDLNEHKIDLECSGGWPDALRGKQLYYTHPIFYLPFYMYARANDTRFDKDLMVINNEAVRFATMDGDFSAIIHDERFPKSQVVSVPSNGPFANLYIELADSKADVTGMDAFSGEPYMIQHPGIIKRIPSPPLRVIPNNMSLARGETDFQNALNTATDALLNDGVIDRILDKYTTDQQTLFRVNKPYTTAP